MSQALGEKLREPMFAQEKEDRLGYGIWPRFIGDGELQFAGFFFRPDEVSVCGVVTFLLASATARVQAFGLRQQRGFINAQTQRGSLDGIGEQSAHAVTGMRTFSSRNLVIELWNADSSIGASSITA